ncbi:MAG: sigma-70 family RNA polymerase sigma factor [Verrucomicrobia bacterium]|nr:sigma-70 family RNA polymerase sigma factor [Verrucomicrobiota bacterium]
MIPDLDEKRWVRAAQQGDAEAFGVLVGRHHRGVRACLVARMHDAHEAEDLAQEVFVTAYRKLAEFDPERPLAPWLRSITLNILRNHWRKFRAQAVGGSTELATLLDRQIAAECGPAREPLLHAALRDCLERMDGPARELLHRRYGEEESVRELSDRLQRGYSALTMQLHRLREILSECIGRKLRNLESAP